MKTKTLLISLNIFLLTAAFLLPTFTFAQFTKLLDFDGVANGSWPNESALISDGTFLYGVTYSGGTSPYTTGVVTGCGTVYKIKPDGTGFSKLLDFAGVNGKWPLGSLFSDSTYLYGTTVYGGTNDSGIVFKIKTDGTEYSNLLDFAGPSNGSRPSGSFISDGTFLFGTTRTGGTTSNGTIYKIKHDGTGYTKLFDFSGTNGSQPNGSLLFDGNFLYGMTRSGGTNNLGTIFKIKTDGTGYSKLLDFSGVANGSEPYSSIISDGTFLYGTTRLGGTGSCTTSGCGTIFKIKPDGSSYSKILDFIGTNGKVPRGDLIYDGTFLYGTAPNGGTATKGVLFKIKHDGKEYSKLYDFTGSPNSTNPYGSLISDGTFLYGTSGLGGANNLRTIFKFKDTTKTTAVAENHAESGFTIYPNPATSILHIEATSPNEAATIVGYNTLGEKVFTTEKTPLSLRTEVGGEVNVSFLPTGMYFLNLTTQEGKIIMKKLVKE